MLIPIETRTNSSITLWQAVKMSFTTYFSFHNDFRKYRLTKMRQSRVLTMGNRSAGIRFCARRLSVPRYQQADCHFPPPTICRLAECLALGLLLNCRGSLQFLELVCSPKKSCSRSTSLSAPKTSRDSVKRIRPDSVSSTSVRDSSSKPAAQRGFPAPGRVMLVARVYNIAGGKIFSLLEACCLLALLIRFDKELLSPRRAMAIFSTPSSISKASRLRVRSLENFLDGLRQNHRLV